MVNQDDSLYPQFSLYDLFMTNDEDLKSLNDMCTFWNRNYGVSVFADDRFGGIDEKAAKKIAEIAQGDGRYAEEDLTNIYTHFLEIGNSNKPVYPNLRLPECVLFDPEMIYWRVCSMVLGRDNEGNLHFGLSLWKGDVHFLVHLASLLDTPYVAIARIRLSIANRLVQFITAIRPADFSFIMKEMSYEILENCLEEIREKYPNCPELYTDQLQRILNLGKGYQKK